MIQYTNNSWGEKKISGFELGSSWIIVLVRGKKLLYYNYASAGKQHVDNMKTRAISQDGLGSYIRKEKPNCFYVMPLSRKSF